MRLVTKGLLSLLDYETPGHVMEITNPDDLGEMSGQWDLIYSASALAELNDTEARRFISSAFRKLEPGGTLLVGAPAAHFCMVFCINCAGQISGRTEEDMAMLAVDIPLEYVSSQLVLRDSSDLGVYLELSRSFTVES